MYGRIRGTPTTATMMMITIILPPCHIEVKLDTHTEQRVASVLISDALPSEPVDGR